LRFVLTPGIGKARTYDNVPLDVVQRVLRFAPELAAKGLAAKNFPITGNRNGAS
jgi:hypothetical protein